MTFNYHMVRSNLAVLDRQEKLPHGQLYIVRFLFSSGPTRDALQNEHVDCTLSLRRSDAEEEEYQFWNEKALEIEVDIALHPWLPLGIN